MLNHSLQASSEILIQILQAPLQHLHEIQYSDTEQIGPLEQYYLTVMIAYLSGNKEELFQLYLTSPKEIKSLVEMRYEILNQCVDTDKVTDAITSLKDGELSPLWKGEFYFVSALAYSTAEAESLSKKYFLLAYKNLTKALADKKALKSLLNYVVAESRIAPQKSLLSDYHFIISKAKKVRDPITQGVAYFNISREYQILGGKKNALNYIQRALKLLSDDYGSKHYYLALAHRCQIYWELELYNEAHMDFEELIAAKHTSVQGALQVLNRLISSKEAPISKEELSVMWKEKLDELKNPHKAPSVSLTQFENNLISYLEKGPLSKTLLTKKLYGESIDPVSATNRLKVLISRIRKKVPHIIQYQNDTYRLSKNYFLTKLNKGR